MRGLKRLLIVCASTAIALLLAEGALRVADHFHPLVSPAPEPILYTRTPAGNPAMRQSPELPYRIGNLGFRGPDVEIPKPPGRFRILVLGDSLTFGQGVAEERIYPRLLESILHEATDGMDIEVVNLGVPGVGLVEVISLMQEMVPRLEADLVVWGFCINDLDLPLRGSRHAAPPTPPGGPILWRLARRAGRRQPTLVDASRDSFDPAGAPWGYFRQGMAEAEKLSRESTGLPPVFLFLLQGSWEGDENRFAAPEAPWLVEMLAIQAQVDEAAEQAGWTVGESLELFREHADGRRLAVSRWDGHPNPVAHRLYAEALAESILPLATAPPDQAPGP
jgi:lysophospholipase L1-like esterase